MEGSQERHLNYLFRSKAESLEEQGLRFPWKSLARPEMIF